MNGHLEIQKVATPTLSAKQMPLTKSRSTVFKQRFAGADQGQGYGRGDALPLKTGFQYRP